MYRRCHKVYRYTYAQRDGKPQFITQNVWPRREDWLLKVRILNLTEQCFNLKITVGVSSEILRKFSIVFRRQVQKANASLIMSALSFLRMTQSNSHLTHCH